MKPALRTPPTCFRTQKISPEAAPDVERDGGKWRAGLIRQAAIVTRGEARGHGFWIDTDFLAAIERAINADERGVKTRFTHPSLSDDGLGKFLGRATNATNDGQTVKADIHFSQTAHKTPDGDLAGYIMDLAEQHPESFGASIVFTRDLEAEEQFSEQHDQSPDEENTNNLPHVRLAELEAADIVDEPAVNPHGLFHRPHIAQDADALLSYAIGLSDRPELVALDIDPDRAARFVTRFLDRHHLTIVQKEEKPNEKEVQTMDLTALTLAELRQARPDLVEELTREAAQAAANDAQSTERQRCAAIVEQALRFNLMGLAGQLITEGLTREAAVDRLKDAKIEALSRATPPSPGPSHEPADNPPPDSPEAWEKAWNHDPKLRAEFGDSQTAYMAYMKANKAGRVKVYARQPAN